MAILRAAPDRSAALPGGTGMKRMIRRRGKRERGNVTVTVLLALMVLIAMCALSIDVGVTGIASQELQDSADAAALAAVGTLQVSLDPDAASDAAVATAFANPVLGVPLALDPAMDITMGAWDEQAHHIVPFDTTGGVLAVPDGTLAVRVTARRTENAPDGPIATHFAKAFGLSSVDLVARATAGLTISSKARPPVQAMIVQDQSGSFEDEFPYARTGDIEFVDFMQRCYAEGDKTGIIGFGYHPNHTDPSDPSRKDWTTYHCFPLNSNDDEPSGADATRSYISSIDTVPYYQEPESYSYTNLYAGLLKAATSFVEPAYADIAWQNFVDSLSGYNIGAWWNYSQSITKAKMTPLFEPDFADPAAEHVVIVVSDGMPWYHDNSFPDEASKDLCTYICDRLGDMGVRIHTVTLDQSSSDGDGSKGADSVYNASLCRNGGYAFYTYDARRLEFLMVGVGQVEVGGARLMY